MANTPPVIYLTELETKASYGRHYNRGKWKILSQTIMNSFGITALLSGSWRGRAPAGVAARLGPVSLGIRDVLTYFQLTAPLNYVKPFRTSNELSYDSEDESNHDFPPEFPDFENHLNMLPSNIFNHGRSTFQ